jgi:hypothetical protein
VRIPQLGRFSRNPFRMGTTIGSVIRTLRLRNFFETSVQTPGAVEKTGRSSRSDRWHRESTGRLTDVQTRQRLDLSVELVHLSQYKH